MKTVTGPAMRGHAGRRTAGSAVAGLVYVAAWVVGLVIGPAGLDVTAPDAAVLRAYAESQGAVIAQVVLTQGVAAVALAAVVLALVVLALGQAARGRGARSIARRIEVAGLAAVVLSLVRGAHGIRLAGWVAPGGDSARAGRLFEFISRIGGAKMLLLAIVAVSGTALARQAGVLPPRAAFPRVVLAAALTAGGVGYLLLSPPLAWMALLALPLLLIWVAGMGAWLSLDPAASQPTGSTRQPRSPVTAACARSRPQRPAHQADLSRAAHPGQRQLHASATCAKSAGRRPSRGQRRGERPVTSGHQAAPAFAAAGSAARPLGRTTCLATAMSIPSPSPLRGSFTPVGDSKGTLAAPGSFAGAASSGATAAAMPSQPPWHLLVNPSPKERPMMTSAAAADSLTMPPVPIGRPLPRAGNVLLVTARPGQESADLGGLLYAFRRSGASLALLCLTRGEASPLNSTWCRRLEAIRPWEVQLAANVLGICEVTVASCPDGGLPSHPVAELTQLVRHAIRRYSADLLLVIAPEAGDPDDTAVARAACAAARQAGVPVVARAVPRAGGTWMIDLGADAATARAIQKSAAAAHQSQSQALPELVRRLDLLDGREALRWLVPPSGTQEHGATTPAARASA